jgi:hypothetical protein
MGIAGASFPSQGDDMEVGIRDRIRFQEDEIEDSAKLRGDEAQASLLARKHGHPVLLVHNTMPGTLAGCHARAFGAAGIPQVQALLEGKLVLGYAEVSQIREMLGQIMRHSARDPDPDMAAAILVRGYDATGRRIRES